ncbi:MAG: 4Fe-4S binding protein [Candidatus Margulisbacteria bacterium]|nr:4Fe-4S binding protein [Candidatus Margulisiibacteriota bacterium]
MKRKIIKIDESKCNGCGECVPNCAEGALQIVNGKAKLVSDVYCDGLGACLGHCPMDAIAIEEREADEFDEEKVKEHLKEENNEAPLACGCPGTMVQKFSHAESGDESGRRESQLRQWPIQLHLVPPNAPYFKNSDVLLAADCTAFSVGDFHKDYLKGKSLAIACPKLDNERESYIEKLTAMIDEVGINTLTVMIMEVPCCSGLLGIAKEAAARASRKIPIKSITISLRGEKMDESWVSV